MYLQPTDFQQGYQDQSMGKEESLQRMVLGHLDIHMQKKKKKLDLTQNGSTTKKVLKREVLERNIGINLTDLG